GDIVNVSTVSDLNREIQNGQISELIKISEVLHVKKIAYIADKLNELRNTIKLVLIAGPSSSGKTTFSKRLSIQLKINGLRPIQISLDDYFVDRDKTPLDEKGEHDFEALEAIDIDLFNKHLKDLLKGKEVEIPVYNFKTGSREWEGHKLKMEENSVLIIEGIHGLNPGLTPLIDRKVIFKIYVSALTQLNIDKYNRIPTTDTRILRRIVRDSLFRNYSAGQTINRWPSVRRGEDKYIFPYQENADIMFNSALIYEISILKRFAEQNLRSVTKDNICYSEAKRLLKFLSYFIDIPPTEVPPTSIIREFIGDSSFHY
ncbi:MAG: nucleoside kinase, partial [bacterium]|nr:nucleoside kinase [bacterium]